MGEEEHYAEAPHKDANSFGVIIVNLTYDDRVERDEEENAEDADKNSQGKGPEGEEGGDV